MAPTQRTVAGWVLEERLGSGGFGEVWRARKRHVDLRRAVKLTPIAGERTFASWRHEIESLEAISHPNIVRFYDADIVTDEGPYRDHAWIATELCERSLAQELERRPGRTLPEGECEQLVEQMLAALAAAHEGGSVHRDIKPANILRHSSGAWKLCDFGTARLIPQGASHPHTAVVGTSPYMSGAAHRGRQDHSADLYALGVTLHEALSGRRLHHRPPGMTDSEFVKLILDTAPTVSDALPPRWQAVVRELITVDESGPGRPDRTAGALLAWFRRTGGTEPLPGRAGPAAPAASGSAPAAMRPPLPETMPAPGLAEGTDVDVTALGATAHQHRKTTAVQSATALQPTRPAAPSPPRQVFVPAPPEPRPAPPAPQPAMYGPAPGAAPPGPSPAPPAADPWAPANVVGRRFLAFGVDAVVVYLVALVLASIVTGAMLLLAYDQVDSEVTGPDPGAHCRVVDAGGDDCRVYGGLAVPGRPFQGRVFIRDEALWGSGQITAVAVAVPVLVLGVLRQGRRGTTPGKRLVGIRTVGPDGGPPGRWRALLRTALLAVDVFVWPFLLAAALVVEKAPVRRRLGDQVANTWVLKR